MHTNSDAIPLAGNTTRGDRVMTYALWIVQGLLALLFLCTGGMKLVTPFDVLAPQMPYPLPEVFVRFIGLCEVAGALGLVLPGLLRIRPGLTALAAGGLVIIMLGAAMFTPPDHVELVLLPLVVGVLAAFVAFGRRRAARPRRPSHRGVLQPAA